MEVSILSVIPFILLLLCIAAAPFIPVLKWEKNYHIVSVIFSAGIIIYYISIGKSSSVLHSLEEYIMFISLVASLFIVSGGILIEISGSATPLKNTILLACGAVIANLFSTTGASMLLIRPFIKTNKKRIAGFHIVFFIFIISNIGGALTPIGDPPLLLGYIKGIPFFWLIDKVFLRWLITILILLIVFYVFDTINFRKQVSEIQENEIKDKERLKIKGSINFIYLAIIIGSVFITSPVFLREIIMLAAAFISYKTTKKEIHEKNQFDFHPIKEVGWLFIGIFVTMMPVLELLANHSGSLNLTSTTQYYWYTGLLSAVLDNAPTYLTFLSASMGANGMDINNIANVLSYISVQPANVMAISIAAVFFGAMTYIGNAPNFMVKSIAENQGVKMPAFFGYLYKYSIPILIPVFILIWWLFIT